MTRAAHYNSRQCDFDAGQSAAHNPQAEKGNRTQHNHFHGRLAAAWAFAVSSLICTCSSTTAILLMEVEVMLPQDSLTPAFPSLLRSF